MNNWAQFAFLSSYKYLQYLVNAEGLLAPHLSQYTNILSILQSRITSHIEYSITLPGSYSLIMSSLRLVPPVVTITLAPICFDNSINIWLVCKANSLVGTMHIAEKFKIIIVIRALKKVQSYSELSFLASH